MSKIHVYLMPGLAASSKIFEFIKLPENDFEIHLLDWEMPLSVDETLENYAFRMAQKITYPQAVLLGASFGGILVQEMTKHIECKKVIIVSSVKTRSEFPIRLRFEKMLKIYQFLPVFVVSRLEMLSKFSLGKTLNERMELYDKYLSVRDETYLKWAVKCIITWKTTQTDPKIVHIHGDNDLVFPIKNIKNATIIAGGTHVMIINRCKWFNENLPQIIQEN